MQRGLASLDADLEHFRKVEQPDRDPPELMCVDVRNHEGQYETVLVPTSGLPATFNKHDEVPTKFNKNDLPAKLSEVNPEGQMVQEYGVQAVAHSSELRDDLPLAIRALLMESNLDSDIRTVEGYTFYTPWVQPEVACLLLPQFRDATPVDVFGPRP